MNDQLGLFDRHDDETGELDLTELRAALARTAAAEPAKAAPRPRRTAPRRDHRALREAAARRRMRRRRSTVLAVAVLAIIAAAVVVGVRTWRSDATSVADFAGSGTTDLVIRVDPGDSLSDIADTLYVDKVVASTAAFLAAAGDNADIKKITNGYYKVKVHASGAATVSTLTGQGLRRQLPGPGRPAPTDSPAASSRTCPAAAVAAARSPPATSPPSPRPRVCR